MNSKTAQIDEINKFTSVPICLNIGCNYPCAHSGTRYRPFCNHCHTAGYKNTPLRPGVKAFKTGKCSNSDGHLGFFCGWDYNKAVWAIGRTQIDHKDGNHLNNHPSNADEVCQICHSHKGMLNGDFKIQNKYAYKK